MSAFGACEGPERCGVRSFICLSLYLPRPVTRGYPTQKFQSDAERKLAIILERESEKWFKPARGQFQLFYRSGTEDLEYQPDFVAETATNIYMLEPNASNQMSDPDVLAKRDVAVEPRHRIVDTRSDGSHRVCESGLDLRGNLFAQPPPPGRQWPPASEPLL